MWLFYDLYEKMVSNGVEDRIQIWIMFKKKTKRENEKIQGKSMCAVL